MKIYLLLLFITFFHVHGYSYNKISLPSSSSLVSILSLTSINEKSIKLHALPKGPDKNDDVVEVQQQNNKTIILIIIIYLSLFIVNGRVVESLPNAMLRSTKERRDILLSLSCFDNIRLNNGLYIDKTREIHNNLLRVGKYYFLVRPRRFGKSLLCSTLSNLFGGKSKELLYEDLWIGKSGLWDFEKQEHPVIHLDMSSVAGADSNVVQFQEEVKLMLEDIAISAGVEINCDKEGPIELYLLELIWSLKEKHKKPVVVIIDEYDKPILDLLDKPEHMEAVRESLQTFYSILKSQESNLRLVFITGLCKFNAMSMFSTLNNLHDISYDLSAGTLVGYTESEIKEYFGDHIQAFKSKLDITDDDVLMNELRERYNGYSFGLDTANGEISEPIYNPFEINYVFRGLQFSDEWTLSGSASMLSKKLIERGLSYESMLITSVRDLQSYTPREMSITTLMYYGGYATIDKYDKVMDAICLKIPNKSIKKNLARNYLRTKFSTSSVSEFERASRKVYDVMTVTPITEIGSKLKEIGKLYDNVFNRFPYEAMKNEREFQNVMNSMFKFGFNEVAHEVETSNGQIDTVITEKSRIFIIKYKYNETSSSALKQIKKNEYYAQYLSTNLSILLFGISLRTKNKSNNRYIDIACDIKNDDK